MSDPFAPATGKSDAVARLAAVTGAVDAGLGPGSKERRAMFLELAVGLGVAVNWAGSKPEICQQLADHFDMPWDDTCWSAGNTITLNGLNRILEGAERYARRARATHLEGVDVTQFGISVEEAADFDALAENLAFLSSLTPLPKGVPGVSGEPFEQDAVDFTTAKWIAQVGTVQGWLHFPGALPLVNPEHALGSLTEWLAPSETPLGVAAILDALDARASRARQFAERFIEDVDENEVSLAVATGQWSDAWDEADAAEDEVVEPEPLIAQATTWSISDFSSRAVQGKLNLAPSYQRSDVWPLSDRQLLIQSILRGIPLPSVILLTPQTATMPYEVVDGKQRLTTVLRFVGKHPVALRRVRELAQKFPDDHLENLFQTDYPKFAKVWKSRTGETLTSSLEADYYFPFKLPANAKGLPAELHPVCGKYYTQIRDRYIQVSGSGMSIGDLFEQSTSYKVPLIEYSKTTQRQIHEVFKLYNKQGKHLNAEEIRNAIYHELELTKASLLVAGDADAGMVDQIAPALSQIWPTLDDTGSNLKSFNFGTSRYKRTKVLMWVFALLLFDPRTDDGGVRRLSTAQHINALLDRVQGRNSDDLRRPDVLRDVFTTVSQAISAHQAELEWAPTFGGSKWQELQLVASLVAVAAAIATHPDDYEELLAEQGDAVYSASESARLSRPSKTQTNVQWNYVARIVTDLLDAMSISPGDAAAAVEKRFGSTGLYALLSLASKLPDGPITS